MREEKASGTFTKMDSPHYMEVANMLLNKLSGSRLNDIHDHFVPPPPWQSSAADDIPRADEIRALVKDLWDLRVAKLRRSMDHMITQQETYAKVRDKHFVKYCYVITYLAR